MRHTVETCSAIGAKQETQQHVPQGQQSPRSRSTRAVADEPHTTQSTETTLLPCRRSTILWPANCSAVPRALAPEAPGHLPRVVRSGCWQSEQTRPEALWTNVCPPRWMAGSAGNGRGQGRARSRRLAVARPRPGIQVESASKRCLAARNPVSHACDGQVGRKPRLFHNQLASRISQVVPSPIIGSDHTSQHRFRSGVGVAQASQASISHQTSSHKSAHADVLASVAFRPRWSTRCSTKLLSVTY